MNGSKPKARDITGKELYPTFVKVKADVANQIPVKKACEKHKFDRVKYYRWLAIENEPAGGQAPPEPTAADPRDGSVRTPEESLALAS